MLRIQIIRHTIVKGWFVVQSTNITVVLGFDRFPARPLRVGNTKVTRADSRRIVRAAVSQSTFIARELVVGIRGLFVEGVVRVVAFSTVAAIAAGERRATCEHTKSLGVKRSLLDINIMPGSVAKRCLLDPVPTISV